MNAADLIHHYGYWAIVAGTFFEGEMIMMAAGIAAAAGLLSLPLVFAAGMAGIFASDTVCFLLGRLARGKIRRWFPRWYERLGGVFQLIERHEDKLIVYFQFFPGLCTVTPIAYGMTGISAARFMALDLVGNAFWTLVFSVGSYAFGTAFERAASAVHHWEPALLALVAVGLFAWWYGRRVARALAVAAYWTATPDSEAPRSVARP